MHCVFRIAALSACCLAASSAVLAQKPNSSASKSAAGQATENSKVKIGVTDSAYDDIGSVLRSLNVAFQFTAPSNSPLTEFNCLFVGCATTESGKFPVKETRDYVQRGGVLYVSDLAFPILQEAFPEFVSNFQQSGMVGMFTCNVLDKKMAKEFGPQMTLNFDAPGWANPGQLGKGTQVMLSLQQQGTQPVPVLVTFKFGRGKVVYTSFHNHANANALELKLIRNLVETPLVAARDIQAQLKSGNDLNDLQKLGEKSGSGSPAVKITPQSAGKMSPDELLSAIGGADTAGQEAALSELYERKGGEATLALGDAITKLDDSMQVKARDLLVKRMARLTAKNLAAYLASDAGLEVRVAAAKAAESKNESELTGQLIAVLQEVNVKPLADAAHGSLTKITAQNFGPFVGARTDQRFVTAGKWKAWWDSQKR